MFAFLYIIIIDMFYYVAMQSVYDVDLFYVCVFIYLVWLCDLNNNCYNVAVQIVFI